MLHLHKQYVRVVACGLYVIDCWLLLLEVCGEQCVVSYAATSWTISTCRLEKWGDFQNGSAGPLKGWRTLSTMSSPIYRLKQYDVLENKRYHSLSKLGKEDTRETILTTKHRSSDRSCPNDTSWISSSNRGRGASLLQKCISISKANKHTSAIHFGCLQVSKVSLQKSHQLSNL